MKTKVTAATFQCKQCGERITLLNGVARMATPKKCKCGSKDFELVSRKLEDFVEMPKAEFDKLIESMYSSSIIDGEITEAEKSLRLRFTEHEIQALLHMFWFSEVMQSIRNRLGELERRLKSENKE